MYKLNISLENPMTGESRAFRFQFDPATFDEKNWSAAFAPVRAEVDEMIVKEKNPARPDLVPIDLASLSTIEAPNV